MRRTLFTVASGLSLLICLTTLGLWVRSIGHFGNTLWSRPDLFAEVYSVDGVLGLTATRDSRSRSPIPGGGLYGRFAWRSKLPPGRDRASLISPTFNRFGFGWHVVKTENRPEGIWREGNRKLLIVYLPFWLPAAITGYCRFDGWCCSCDDGLGTRAVTALRADTT